MEDKKRIPDIHSPEPGKTVHKYGDLHVRLTVDDLAQLIKDMGSRDARNNFYDALRRDPVEMGRTLGLTAEQVVLYLEEE